MSLNAFLEPVRPGTGPVTLPGAAQWMQGRTLYGGASALLAYTAATRAFPQLPPLRAAQVGFVAPVGETVEARVTMLREGRNVIHLRSELLCERQVALTALWLFGAARPANGRHPATRLTTPGDPEALDDLPHAAEAPGFIRHNFTLRRAVRADGAEGAAGPRLRRWLRLHEHGILDPVSEAILVGDTLPPSAIRQMERPGPISSVNWSFNVLDTQPAHPPGGWWLAENSSEQADLGYSTERLGLWRADGTPVLSGMQAVAVFG